MSAEFVDTNVLVYAYDPTTVNKHEQARAAIDGGSGPDPQSATSDPLADGVEYFFHLRTCDAANNCTSTVHLGPFWIDSTPPTLPVLTSPSHALNIASLIMIVNAAWTQSTDSLNGLAGYQLTFSQSAAPPATAIAALGPAITTGSSAPLSGGSWYIHLSAVDVAGNAVSATYGPVVISAAAIPTVSPAMLLLLAAALAAVAAAKLSR